MRRFAVLAVALAIGLSTGVQTVTADTTGGCLGPGQCRMTGQEADAFWIGTPDTGPVPAVVYTDTWVSVGVGSLSGGGLRSTSSWTYVDRFSYMYGANLDWIPVAETFGFGAPPDVSVVVAKRLSGATVSGTVTAVTCTYDGTGNEACSDPFAMSVSGVWTATGARMQSVSTGHWKGGGSSYTSTFQGAQRFASVSVSVDGVAPGGSLAWADVADSQSNTVSICHGPTC